MKSKRYCAIILMLMSLTTTMVGCTSNSSQQSQTTKTEYSLDFDSSNYTTKTLTVDNKTVTYRAYENIVYVKNPVDVNYEIMNIYVPEEYFEGKSIGTYTADNAPIYFPNSIGGYMPATPTIPGQAGSGMGGHGTGGAGGAQGTTGDQTGGATTQEDHTGGAAAGAQGTTGGTTGDQTGGAAMGTSGVDAASVALSKGYIVASAGARGRTTQGEDGTYTGKAPAGIVDLKAAVRYLRYNDSSIPGTAEKIISDGTSAGGAYSALLGATGNSSDYDSYLEELGAADTRDDIFASMDYCPITNLDNADTAYEWLFNGVNSFNNKMSGGAGTLTEEQINLSNELKALFPAYVNSLGLKSSTGTALTLDANGDGTFKTYVKSYIIASAQKALDSGTDLSSATYLTISGKTVTDVDLAKYVAAIGRMKSAPGFDGVDLSIGENQEFGTETVDTQHFTQFSQDNSTVSGSTMADSTIIKMMNPMNYIGTEGATTAKYWRIRYGSVDNNTSLAIPTILATTLQNKGYNVDFSVPWGIGHAGDYDLTELFTWMDQISQA